MSANYQYIRSQVDALDNEEKIRLLSELFDLLGQGAVAAREARWAAAAESRLAAYDDGRMAAEDWHTLRGRRRLRFAPDTGTLGFVDWRYQP